MKGKVKDKWLKKFEEKYKKVSKELKKKIIKSVEFRDALGGPTLRDLKKKTGYTFLEAERAIGIERENADRLIEASRQEDKKVFCVGRNMGEGSEIYLRDCIQGCNDYCKDCEYLTEDETINSITAEEAKAARCDHPSHMSGLTYPNYDGL